MKVAVIGAGIAGVSVAYALAKKGLTVSLVDRHAEVAAECSYANGGQVSVCNAESWHTWRNIYNGMRWMFKKDAPFYIPLSFNADRLRWITTFLRHTASGHYDSHTRQLIALGLYSRALYEEVAAEEGIAYHRHKGIIHVYRTEQSFERAKRTCAAFADTGWNREPISAEEVCAKVPEIRQEGIVGGTLSADDFSGDMYVFCQELLACLINKYGVQWLPNTPVSRLHKEQKGVQVLQGEESLGVFDRVVVATGAYGNDLIQPLMGAKLPLYPVKGYSITLPLGSAANGAPKYSILDEEVKIVCSTFDTQFRVAGTAEMTGWNHDILPHRITPLVRWVERNFPQLSVEEYTSWACLRPMAPDMLPTTKEVCNGVYVSNGAGHLGWTLGMGIADQLAKKIK